MIQIGPVDVQIIGRTKSLIFKIKNIHKTASFYKLTFGWANKYLQLPICYIMPNFGEMRQKVVEITLVF